ncbi:phosphatase PAP2 family protein [Modestobacter altitudinis]|uniref:phosphatase PAP2 family protein n=1 Tax=Modestobacter altitudinis TaxID=2213158 RepID=UPI00110C9EF2|nr:phosphatase PAP2 family protein [Modestobacter altitudinis]
MSATASPGRRPAAPLWWSSAALLLVWGVVLGMVVTREGLAEDDAPVLSWFVGHRSSALTGFFEAVSGTVLDGAAALLAAAIVLLIAVRSRSVSPLLTLGASVVGAVALAELVKAVVGRARPATAAMLGVPETGSGFPSAHTLVVTALAGAVALVVWRATRSVGPRVLAVAGAAGASAVMGASRLYLGDHWLTDVLASYALAGALLAAVAALTDGPGW